MLNSLPVTLLVSTVLGFLAGLGIGGGSLLMLWLTAILGMEHPAARGINLLFFLPCAVISCLFRWKQGKLKFRHVLPAIISGCISAAVFAWLSGTIRLDVLQKLFGILLLATGLRELFYRPRNAR